MLTLGTRAVSETEARGVTACPHGVNMVAFTALWSHRVPFLVSAVLFCVVLEVCAMSELACGVTLAFTVSPLPFPFLSFFELPLGTSAMSFCRKGKSDSLSWHQNEMHKLCVCVCLAGRVPCRCPTPSSGRLSSLRWSGTSLGLTEHPQWLENTNKSRVNSEKPNEGS